MMISIIIPTYNEANGIYRQLEHLLPHVKSPDHTEIIVVDGGSKDRTLNEIMRFINQTDVPFSSIRVAHADQGRAKQLNLGASQAQGEVLYFLHADTTTCIHFDEKIRNAVTNGVAAGCFRMKFDHHHPLLRISGWFTRFNWKICRGGDQSLFVKKEVYESLGGFNEAYSIYEDCEFINRLYDYTTFKVLPDQVITSSRRYTHQGPFRLQFHFAVIHLKHWGGASPKRLREYYVKHIAQ